MKTCRFCGKQQRAYMDQDHCGWYCRNEHACFNRLWLKLSNLRQDVRLLLGTGASMANVMFNLSQQEGRTIDHENAHLFQQLYKRWDAESKQVRGGLAK